MARRARKHTLAGRSDEEWKVETRTWRRAGWRVCLVQGHRHEHGLRDRHARHHGQSDGKMVMLRLCGPNQVIAARKRSFAAIVLSRWPALPSLAAFSGFFRELATTEAVEWLQQQENRFHPSQIDGKPGQTRPWQQAMSGKITRNFEWGGQALMIIASVRKALLIWPPAL